MTERPILFSAPMVRALLHGRKTQTRRIVKGLPERTLAFDREWSANVLAPGGSLPGEWSWWDGPPHGQSIYHLAGCPYGVPGDLLWARERWATWMHAPSLPEGLGGALSRNPGDWLYAATDPEWEAMDHDRRALKALNAHSEDGRAGNYVIRNSIHMPRWASRITLRVADVRVERLNDISEADALAEGVAQLHDGFGFEDMGHDASPIVQHNPALAYRFLWERIHGPGSWDANPFVWAVTFEVVR